VARNFVFASLIGLALFNSVFGLSYVTLLPVYADWYFDSISASCPICARHPESFTASPGGKDRITAHNIHAVGRMCAELLSVPQHQRYQWLTTERIDAATRHQSMFPLGTSPVKIDPTLLSLIHRDYPSWSIALRQA